MPKKKTIDEKALIAMVAGGNPQKEIMEKFGFKTPTQLKVAYANAQMASGTIPEIKKGRKTAAKAAASKNATVNKRGSLVITKALVEDMGFAVGEVFAIRKTKSGISLRKM